MKKKRSKGVTIFAWSFIIFNILGLLTVGNLKKLTFLSDFNIFAVILYSIAYSIVGIVAGVNVLQLKEWSKKLIIALAILGIVDMVIFVPISHKSIEISKTDPKTIEVLEEQYNRMPEDYMPKDKFMDLSTRIGHVMIGIIEIIVAIYLALMLLFFTRPKVKRQFMQKS